MMRPIECHISALGKSVVVWVAETFNVAVTFCAFGTEIVEGFFGVVGVAGDGRFDFFVDHNVDLNSLLCFALQDLVETVFLVIIWWAAQEKFG